MEKSIENIWKNGFTKNEDMIVPKINELYNRKSLHIVDMLKRKMKTNIKMLYGFAFIALIGYWLIGAPGFGIFFFLLFIGLALIPKNGIGSIENIDHSLSSYEYLKAINSWLENRLNRNIKHVRWFYPLVFMLSIIAALKANGIELSLEKGTNEFMTTLIAGSIMIIGMSIFIIFARPIYMFDFRTLYGGTMDKLKEMIEEMEELRD